MSRVTGSSTRWLLITLLLMAASLHSHNSQAFKVYSNFERYTNLPDLSEYGVGQVKLLTTGTLWAQGDDQEQVPTDEKLDRLKSWSEEWVGIDMVVADIEHWPLNGDDELVSESMRKFEETFLKLQTRLPQYPIGFYSMPPIRDYWRAVKGPESDKYQEWLEENNKLKPLAEKADAIFPSLYTFYDNVDGWKVYARENILEARRLANGKPVICYIWPRFHDSNATLKRKLIPGLFWREQLELIKEYADGVVIWDLGNAEWADDAEWWVETVKFIERYDLDKPLPSTPPAPPSALQAIAE